MAMSGTAMGDAVVAALKVANPAITGAIETEMKAAWEIIAGAIVTYIAANAQVNVTAPEAANIATSAATTISAPNAIT